MPDYRPRLSIEISKKSYDLLQELLTHGTKKIVFNQIVEDLISIMQQYGSGKIIGAFIERDLTLKNIIKVKLE